ncbi:glycosyltransferase [Pontibacter cellulosilyticus]|uniref:Glycosyltransferase n=1 Tax=Pontibacter cellulosilyticus TaxID=1720253 RepID=A0A923SI11_9BACT|nr:glycosyltransferase [Pontibacter cellulosilyticus]MBC5992319.1 glycosyltransferase [Pontibacter cellulosilyticus]
MENITQEVLDVCVLIPYYNNLEGLVKSLNTIKYSSGKFLVLVVDDGSSIALNKADVSKRAGHPVPFHIINCHVNGGITKALNIGLSWIQNNLKVKYIARLDCGDTCRYDRFYKQISFLDNNPVVGLLGSWCRFESPDGRIKYNYITPVVHSQIMQEMHLRNVFIHPTVIFRSCLIEETGMYPEDYEYVEDYAFFWTMLRVSQGAILDELLTTCEVNALGISISQRQSQLKARIKVVKKFAENIALKMLGIIKLRLLLLTPYPLVLKIKQRL